jgi:hypothetical protein
MLLAGIFQSDLWYALPLVASVSLVYAATRHEVMKFILAHAARVAAWIIGLMAVILVVLMIVTATL